MLKLITLTTDFGLTDGFVGTMRGVILNLAPDATMVDISHDITPQNITQGAFVLASSVPYFPERAVHVCVVDPGVGSERKAIAVAVGETFFVAPDNGVISLAVAAIQPRSGEKPRAVRLDKPRYWLPRVSNTFHGRDIFASVAAHLANGVALEELGVRLEEFVTLALPAPQIQSDGAILGHVVYIDRFGNLATDLPERALAAFERVQLRITIGNHVIVGLKNTFADVARGELVAFISSGWELEIAVREGSAAQVLSAHVGDSVRVAVG